jgi:hypothetical protein
MNMAEPKSIQDDFLILVRLQLGKPELSFEEAMQEPLAKTLFDLMAGNLATEPGSAAVAEAPPPALASFAQSLSVLESALKDTFTLEELKAGEEERAALLAATDVVMLQRERRLCLTDAARAEILSAVAGSSLYQTTLRAVVNQDQRDFDAITTDPIRLPTAWLRGFLLGEFGDPDRSPRTELAAALTARRRLRLVTNLPSNVPTVADLERRLSFADLLEPLRLLVGAKGGWDHVRPYSDRFVGRKSELSHLRGFVDELSSRSAIEAVTRFATSAASTAGLIDKSILRLVQADGGLGKSALLAKFVLDHALDQRKPFPFAYLDFDSAALDPNEPNQLLIEMARQVGLQFPNSQPQFTSLISDIRQDRRQASPAVTSTSQIRDPFANFVEILREHATQGSRAFLLILDTLEIVQWNPVAIDRLASILFEFRAKGLTELRVVASGRADIPQLRSAAGSTRPGDVIQLHALSVDEAVDMATQLGEAAIDNEWDPAWSKVIVGGPSTTGLVNKLMRVLSTREDVRREPLTVRVAVDLVIQAGNRSEREQIVRDISDLSDKSQASLAARLYQRRIVGHVKNPNARKLAWPGLVLRRVTPEIARNLLAPLCELAPDDVDDAFHALAKEVWMVVQDGDGLKHLPHLRARTLPLMRATDPEKFEKTAKAAVEYFGSRREMSREDRAEWIYQRLILGTDIKEVVGEITPEILPKLAGAADDFPEESEAASFLASRTATARLSPERIRSLKPQDALYHLSVTSEASFGFDDVSIDQVTLELARQLTANHPPLSDELRPWAQALWIKTGKWREVSILPQNLPDIERTVQRAFLFLIARSLPYLSLDPMNTYQNRQDVLPHFGLRQIFGELKVGTIGFRSATQVLALARQVDGDETFTQLDERIDQMLSRRSPNPRPSTQAALRTAIIFGNKCRRRALDLWLMGRRRGTRDRVIQPTFSASELRTLAEIDPQAFSLFTHWKQAGNAGFFYTADDETISSASRILEEFLASPTDDSEGDDLGRRLARVFACRDEDWIVPFGYAAERMLEGRYQDVLRKRIASYSGFQSSKSRSPVPVWNDMLGAMRIADEAGDLPGFARFLALESAGDEDARADLMHLLDCRDQWSRQIDALTREVAGRSGTRVNQLLGDAPPPPGPVLHNDDPQKGRWGGRSERGGRKLSAVLESAEKDIYYFSLVVESIDGSELKPPVIFHLHDSYPISIVHIRRVVDGRLATLSDWNAYGVFSAGVQVMDQSGRWISLELDLATIPNLPRRFLER